MNRYHIQRLVSSVAHTYDTKEYNGYTFAPLNQSAIPGGFLVTKVINATSYSHAYFDFINNLEPILDCVSLVTQSIIKHGPSGSHVIYRLNNNEDKVFFAYLADYGEAVGMDFDLKSWDDISTLLNINDRGFLLLLRESNTAYTPRQRLALLLMAIESIAGSNVQKRKCRNCGTEYEYPGIDKEKVKTIVGAPLADELFGKGGIRHRLFHGVLMDEALVMEKADAVYGQLLFEYLVPKYRLTSLQQIANPPRAVRIEVTRTFLKNLKGSMPDLLDVKANLNSPAMFEIIQAPASY
ncbi:MAG: hypothetical protein V1685_04690 [Parcubacteria group bacterium]